MTNETDPRLAQFLHLRGIAHPPPEQAQAANEAALGLRFCANPKCQLHRYPAADQRQVTTWERDRKGNPYPVTRSIGHTLLRAGPKEIRLCHVCAEAVKMAIAISAKPTA